MTCALRGPLSRPLQDDGTDWVVILGRERSEPRRTTGAENGQTKRQVLTMFITNATGEDDMASIRKEIAIEAPAARVWDALRDFHAVDTRLATGFVVKSVPEGNTRVLTFSNGSVAREELVSADDSTQRLVYAICTSERLRHYQGAAQVFAEGDRRCRFVWVVDVLPEEMAVYINDQMSLAVPLMKKRLEGTS